jgi:hypothetical protein
VHRRTLQKVIQTPRSEGRVCVPVCGQFADFPSRVPSDGLGALGRGVFRLLSSCRPATGRICCNCGVAESGVRVPWAWLVERIIEIWGWSGSMKRGVDAIGPGPGPRFKPCYTVQYVEWRENPTPYPFWEPGAAPKGPGLQFPVGIQTSS